MYKKPICPECKGTKVTVWEKIPPNSLCSSDTEYAEEPCYFCQGTGFASEEDTFEDYYKR